MTGATPVRACATVARAEHARIITSGAAGRERLVIDGRLVSVSPLPRGDVATIVAVFEQLSPESRLRRYLTPATRLTSAAARALADADGHHHHAVVVHELADSSQGCRQHPEPVAIGRLVRTGPRSAEAALEVGDAWQRRGLGRLLIERLLRDARALGIETVEGTASAENRAILRLLREYLGLTSVRFGSGLVEFSAPIPPADAAPRSAGAEIAESA